jgi:hypothetical protein
MSGYFMSTLSANLMVVLVVSDPARYRVNTVDSKFSSVNSEIGLSFSWGDPNRTD